MLLILIRIYFCSSPLVTLEFPVESESNLESDSDSSEDDMKERGETEADSDAERTPLKLATHKSSANLSANSSLLGLQVIKPRSLPGRLLTPTRLTSSAALSNHSTPSSSFTLASLPGNKDLSSNRASFVRCSIISKVWLPSLHCLVHTAEKTCRFLYLLGMKVLSHFSCF